MSASDDASDSNRSESNDVLRVGEDISLDALFRAFADRRRRCLIRFFLDRSERTAAVERLVDHLLEQDPDSTDRKSTRVALHHNLLPLLEDVGIVDLDRSRGAVTYRGVNRAEAVLALVADCEPGERTEAVGTQIGIDRFAD